MTALLTEVWQDLTAVLRQWMPDSPWNLSATWASAENCLFSSLAHLWFLVFTFCSYLYSLYIQSLFDVQLTKLFFLSCWLSLHPDDCFFCHVGKLLNVLQPRGLISLLWGSFKKTIYAKCQSVLTCAASRSFHFSGLTTSRSLVYFDFFFFFLVKDGSCELHFILLHLEI